MHFKIIILLVISPLIGISQVYNSDSPDSFESKARSFSKINFVDYDESDFEIKKELNQIKKRFNIEYTNDLIFSHSSGYYKEVFDLNIESTNPNSGTIYYTLDASIPDTSAAIYTNSLTIHFQDSSEYSFKATVVRAQSFQENTPTSKIYSHTFLLHRDIENRFTMPVISLITDPENLFSEDTGIYVRGVFFDPTDPIWTGNYFQTGIDWERDVFIQYFERNGSLVLNQDAGMRIHGGRQRGAPQKSLRLYARNEYGINKFNYRLLPQKYKDEYKRFVLRASYGCWSNTIFKDQMASNLVRKLNMEMQDYKPVIVLINGNYWGIHTIRDYLREHHFADKYNIDKNSVNIGSNITAAEGNIENYIELSNFVDTADLSVDENYQYINSIIDIDDYINYLNTEIFLNNYDWPGSNNKYWYSQEYENGKIRWILYDLDATFQNFFGPVSHNMLEQATVPGSEWPNPEWSTKILSKLLLNANFRNHFIVNAAYLMNHYFEKEILISQINKFKDIYEPEVEEHIDRWDFLSYNSWINNIDESLIFFAENRRNYVNNHYINKFNLSGISKLTIEINDSSMGKIYLNNLPVSKSNISGEYFNDVEMNLIAIPEYGYKFLHWGQTITNTNSSILISLKNDTAIYAYFVKDSLPHLFINEILANNNSNLLDNFGEYDDWIEIYNNDKIEFDLAGLYLTDDYNEPFKWQIRTDSSELTTIKSYDYILIFTDSDEEQGILHTNFKLKAKAEEIALVKNQNGFPVFIDTIKFSDQIVDISFGRYKDGDNKLVSFSNPTPGSSNFRRALLSNIFINEVMTFNVNTITDNFDEHEDWIELYNGNNESVDVGGLFITNNFLNPKMFRIPSVSSEITTITSGGFLILFADAEIEQGRKHLPFQLSENDGQLGLIHVVENTINYIDKMNFKPLQQNQSYGRINDGYDKFIIFPKSTPGESNNTINLEYLLKEKILIFPNPASMGFEIKFMNPNNDNLTLEIYNVNGELQLKIQNFRDNEFSLQNGILFPGIYFVKIHKNGNMIASDKLIIK